MKSNYFNRIYFSRYFYSTFKNIFKCRIKISVEHPVYFYSDPYYFNNKNKGFSLENYSLVVGGTSSARNYFIPLGFTTPKLFFTYDFSWYSYASRNVSFNVIKILIAIKLILPFKFFISFYRCILKFK